MRLTRLRPAPPRPASRGRRSSLSARRRSGNVAETATDGIREVAERGARPKRRQSPVRRGNSLTGSSIRLVTRSASMSSNATTKQPDSCTRCPSGSPPWPTDARGRWAPRRLPARRRGPGSSSRRAAGKRGPQGVMDDVSAFARRRPGIFIAGAVGVGFLVGRAVRATSSSQLAGATERQSAATPLTSPAMSLRRPAVTPPPTPPDVPSVASGMRP